MPMGGRNSNRGIVRGMDVGTGSQKEADGFGVAIGGGPVKNGIMILANIGAGSDGVRHDADVPNAGGLK